MCIRSLASCLSLVLAFSATHAEDAGAPDFYASFQDTASAVDGRGQPIQPKKAEGLRFVDGIRGRAVYLGSKNSLLQYPAGCLLNSAGGTIMFWVQPGWDGAGPAATPTSYRFFNAGAGFDVFMPVRELKWKLGKSVLRDIRRGRPGVRHGILTFCLTPLQNLWCCRSGKTGSY